MCASSKNTEFPRWHLLATKAASRPGRPLAANANDLLCERANVVGGALLNWVLDACRYQTDK